MFADPVQNGMFFGRQGNLNLMKKRIGGLKDGYRQNVALIGHELTGKTSLLLQLVKEVSGKAGVLPVYLLVKPEPFEKFSNRFAGTLLYCYLKKEHEKVSNNIDDLLIKGAGKLPHTVEEIKKIRKLPGRKNREFILSSLFDLLAVLCEEANSSCVMILDEFQELGSLRVRNPFSILGGKIMTQKQVMYIVSSSRTRQAAQIIDNDLSLLFGNFEIDNLEPFGVNKGMDFVKSRLDRFTVNNTAMKFLAGITNGHPFYLDSFCRKIENIANARGVREAGSSIVAEGVSKELSCPRSSVYQHLDSIVSDATRSSSSRDLEILLAVANGNRKSSQIARSVSTSTAQARKSLDRLANSDIIFRCGKVYDFCDPLLKSWIGSVFHKREESFEPITEGMIEADLQRKMEDLISSYNKTADISIGERICNLFSLFRNDVVYFAGKRLKLPKFSKIIYEAAKGHELLVMGFTRNGYWVADFVEKILSDTDIRKFTKKLSGLRRKIGRKILVCLEGIEPDAKLLAKEEEIWLWSLEDLNFIFDLYGQPKYFGQHL